MLLCILKFQLLFLSNWLLCAFEHFCWNLRTINVSLLLNIIIIIIIIRKRKNKKYFNHFNRSEPFNLDRLISSVGNFPCQSADVSLAKHPKGWNAMSCGYIHRLGGDFLLKEQRNIFFSSFLQLMEDFLSGPLGRSAMQHAELELSIEIVHAQIHRLRIMENHATELVIKHKDVTTLTPA